VVRQIADPVVIDVRVAAVASWNGKCPDPIGREFRRILFVKEMLAHAIGKSSERDRAVVKVGEDELRNVNVVVDNLSLGEMRRGVQHLVEIRNRNLTAIDSEFLFLWHTSSRGALLLKALLQ